jgi:glutathione S-transferase
MIDLYHNDMSSCSQKVRFVLEEKVIEWSSSEIDLKNGEQFRPEYKALNSKAVVPTLIHNEAVITESAVICQYLDEAFEGPQLTPTDVLSRAKMRLWLQQIDEYLHADISVISSALVFVADIKKTHDTAEKLEHFLSNIPDPGKRALRRVLINEGTSSEPFLNAIRRYKGFFEQMNVALKQSKYLVGNEMTLADIACLPYLLRFLHLNQQGLFSELPELLSWYDRMCDTTGYRLGIERWFKQPVIDKMLNAGGEKSADIVKVWMSA